MRSNDIVDPFIAQEHAFSEFLVIANKIKPGLPEKTIQVHNTYIQNPKQIKYIAQKYLDTDASQRPEDYNIELLIASALRYAFSLGNLQSAIDASKKYRRDTKRNWVKSLQNEEAKNPFTETTIYKAASTISMANELDPTKNDNRSLDEIIKDIRESIEAWRSNLTATICSYQLLKTKPDHSICTALFHDIVLESLLILSEKAEEILTDDNVKVPKQLHQYPVVSLSQTPSFVGDFIINEVTLSSQYSSMLEDSNLKIDVTMNVPASYTEQSQIKELDTRDQDIITRIFSRFTPSILENKQLTLSTVDFAKEVYGVDEPKKRNYDDLMERMSKLASYTYDITVTDTESGDVIEKTVLSMLSYMKMNSMDKTIVVQPSDQLISSYIQKNFITISSDTYNKIQNNKTRVFMMLLQEQRILEYSKGSSEKTLSLSFFRSRLKTNKMSNTLLRKEITTHLDALVENNCVITGYTFINKRTSVKVVFQPLSDAELTAYGKTDEQKIIDAQTIIDVEDYTSQN